MRGQSKDRRSFAFLFYLLMLKLPGRGGTWTLSRTRSDQREGCSWGGEGGSGWVSLSESLTASVSFILFCCWGKSLIDHSSTSKQWLSNCGLWTPQGSPEVSGCLQSQNSFHNNIKRIFAFFRFHSFMNIQWDFLETVQHVLLQQIWESSCLPWRPAKM